MLYSAYVTIFGDQMKTFRIGLITFALTLLMMACTRPATDTTNKGLPTAAPSPVASVSPLVFASPRANFEKHCVACHGQNGEGGTVTVDNKTLNVPSLTKGHAVTHKDEELAKQITNGKDEMPAFKDKLSPTEIFALVNFIRKELQGK
jgi:menaquinol-cytochrome c reductase cytochrome b/c subunit